MCVYCMIGDHFFRYDPPFWTDGIKFVPVPVNPVKPWGIERLKELEDLLRRVRDLEEKVGCECEPNKADYLMLIRNRIELLERKVNSGPPEKS